MQSALQRLSRQVALESLVDALDARASRWQLETYNRRPAVLYDVLAEMWSAWRALVGEGGTGCLARWRRLVLAFLRKERHQVALESLVDILAAEAGKDFDLLEKEFGPESPMPNLSDLGLVFRCWRLAAGHHLTQTRYKSALTELKTAGCELVTAAGGVSAVETCSPVHATCIHTQILHEGPGNSNALAAL